MIDKLYQDPKESQHVTIYDSQERRFFPAVSRRRDNRFWRRWLATRYAQQLKEEEVDMHDYVEYAEWGAYRKQLNRKGIRYKMIPQERNIVALSQTGGIHLPVHLRMRIRLLDDWIARIPNGKRIGGTRGFGGEWAGSRPKGNPTRYLKLLWSLSLIVNALKEDEVEFLDDTLQNVKLVGLTHDEALEYVKAHFAPAGYDTGLR